MSETLLHPRLWFEDIATGMARVTPSRTVTEADILTFGGLTGDLAELHTSETYARATPFGTRISHGMFNLSLAHGLVCRTGYLEGTGIALLGWNNIAFVGPVRIGETVRARWTTIAKRDSKKHPDSGVITDRIELLVEGGSLAMTGEVTELVRKRPA